MRWSSTPWAVAAAAWGAAAAAVAQPVPEALQACVRIKEDSQRLACFDREMAALSAGNGSASTARPGVASTSAAAASAVAPASSAAAPAASAAHTPSATASAGAATPLTPKEEMGLSAAGIRKLEAKKGISAEAKPPKELTAHLASVSHNSAGREVFTLDNGQVWRQSETRARFEAHTGEAVKITPGALGSFWLSTDTHNWTRVERVP